MLFVERQQYVTAVIPFLPFGRGGSDEILIQFVQVAYTCCSQYITDKQKTNVQT